MAWLARAAAARSAAASPPASHSTGSSPWAASRAAFSGLRVVASTRQPGGRAATVAAAA